MNTRRSQGPPLPGGRGGPDVATHVQRQSVHRRTGRYVSVRACLVRTLMYLAGPPASDYGSKGADVEVHHVQVMIAESAVAKFSDDTLRSLSRQSSSNVVDAAKPWQSMG